MHIDGVDNKVADCLSHYYENDTSEDNHSENTYVNADIRLDPEGKLLPTDRYTELRAAVNIQTRAHAQISADVQLPALFQPRVPS